MVTQLSDAELLELFQGESERSEFKPKLDGQRADGKSFRDEIREVICSFANDLAGRGLPGVIFIGLGDNGICTGLSIDDRLLKSLAELRGDGKINPPPLLTVERKVLNGCEMAIVTVQPAVTPPVWLNQQIYVRIGTTTRPATREEEYLLAERRPGNFDAAPVHGATLDDLDLRYLEDVYIPLAIASRVLQENERNLEHKLMALRLLTPGGVPTVTGILIGGKDPSYFLPGAYIQFRRIDGVDLSDPTKDAEEIHGPIQQITERILDKVKSNIAYRSEMTGDGIELHHPDYPFEALRELIANAFVHRDYRSTNNPVRINWFDDRIEIWNNGGPFGSVTEDNFGQDGAYDYRNPNLAAALKNLGYVEKYGVGIRRANDRLLKNRNAAAQFEVRRIENYVLVTLRKAAL
jgi:ATP-dependent DNA helicase RecG